MPNASDSDHYDPIDGRPSVTDSIPPYAILPHELYTQPKFNQAIGKLKWPESVSDPLRKKCGQALFNFIRGLQGANTTNTPEEVQAKANELTEKLYQTLSEVQVEAFKDYNDAAAKIYVAYVEKSPFTIVFGRAKIQIGESEELVSVDWIVQNVESQDRKGFDCMGGLTQIGISQAMEDLHPGLMERASRQEVNMDEILNIIETSIKQRS